MGFNSGFKGLICYTRVPKMFYSFRSSFHAETCESPTLSGVVTAPISETLMADVLSFLTMRQGVLCQSCATGLNVFRSKQRTGRKKNRQINGCGATILLLEEKRNLKIFQYQDKPRHGQRRCGIQNTSYKYFLKFSEARNIVQVLSVHFHYCKMSSS